MSRSYKEQKFWMKILVEINHPAHVHLYKNLAHNLIIKGHRVFITVKDIPAAKHLLEESGLPYIELPAKGRGILRKALRQIQFDWIVYRLVRKHKIDVAIGTSVTNAHVSRITKMKSLLFDDDDDEVQPLVVRWLHPFADSIFSPVSLQFKERPRKAKQTYYYEGFHELAYLHPDHFRPDRKIPEKLGLQAGEKYFIMRFNVFKAHHDIGEGGLTLQQKLRLVELLKPHGRIFITTEAEVEPELAQYKAPVANTDMHHLLHFATMFLGDSQTMTSEAAVLGTPSIRCNSFVRRIAYLDELEERYQLTFGFRPNEFDRLEEKVKSLLELSDLKALWAERRQKMLNEKINVADFMTWIVENYPECLDEI